MFIKQKVKKTFREEDKKRKNQMWCSRDSPHGFWLVYVADKLVGSKKACVDLIFHCKFMLYNEEWCLNNYLVDNYNLQIKYMY